MKWLQTLVLVGVLAGAMQASDWQKGTVLTAGPAGPVTFVPPDIAWDAFVFQSAGKVYFCREKRVGQHRPAVVSVGGPVEFVVHKSKLTFKDRTGKRHKAFLVDG